MRPARLDSSRIAFVGGLIGGTLLLLMPALWNGFPFIFSDSGTYIDAAIERYIPGDRTVFYSLFLLALHWKINLWPALLVQAVMCVYLVRLFFTTFSSRFSELDVALTLLALTLLSSLPWFVGQLMPDIFSGLLVLSIAIGVVGQDRLHRRDRLLVVALSAFFITTHLSNLPIAAGTLFAAVLIHACDDAGRFKFRAIYTRQNLAMLGAILVAVTLMLGLNVARKNGLTFARTANVMLMAKLMDQGIGIDYLVATCPDRPLPICASLQQLQVMARDARQGRRQIGALSDQFLWGGPLASLGGMSAVTAYASEINSGAIRMYPVEFIEKCFSGFVAQLAHFDLGDDLIKYDQTSSPYSVIKKDFNAEIFNDYLTSRQYLESLDLERYILVSNIFLGFCAAGVAIHLVINRSDRNGMFKLSATILVGLASNAFVTGGLSAVHDRYGSRVIWLIPLLGLLIFSGLIRNRHRMKPIVG